MFTASLMMASDQVYQPKTRVKTKWENIHEMLTLHTESCYPFEDPNYVAPPPKVYQPKTQKRGKWEFLDELWTLRSGLCFSWDDPNYVNPYQDGSYVNLGETTTFLVNNEGDADQDVIFCSSTGLK